MKYRNNINNCFIGIILSILFLLFIIPADATTYYINGTTGNNANSGTDTGHAWATIQKATSTMVAGDTVQIMNGTYHEQVIITTNGTAANYITYMAYPGDENKTTINGTDLCISFSCGNSTEDGLVNISASYINFTWLKVINSPGVGIRIFPHNTNVTILNNSVFNTTTSAIAVRTDAGIFYGPYRSKNMTIDGNDVRFSIQLGGYSEMIAVESVDGFEIKNNRLHYSNSVREGIGVAASTNGSVHNNLVDNINNVPIYIDGYQGNDTNINVYSNQINNTINGISVANEEGNQFHGHTSDINIFDNLIYNTTGFAQISFINCCGSPAPIYNISINSNTIDRKIFIPSSNNFSNITIENNIIGSYTDNSPGGTVFTNSNQNTSTQGAVDFVNSGKGNYHLKADATNVIGQANATTAPSFDFDGTPRPQGAGFSIGAFEFIPPIPHIVDYANTSGFTTSNISFNNIRQTGDGSSLSLNTAPSFLNNLEVYFGFEENTGNTIHNVNRANGTFNTTNVGTWSGANVNEVVGQVGNAIKCDNSITQNQYITIPDSGAFSPSNNNVTVAFWMYSSDITRTGSIVAKGGTTSSNYEWEIRASNQLSTVIYDKFGNNNGTLSATGFGISNNTWIHYVVVMRAGTKLEIYKNGQLNTNTPVWVGNNAGSFGAPVDVCKRGDDKNFANDTVDELRIWSRALNASEIATYYNTSFADNGSVEIYKQNASVGKVVNQFAINSTNNGTAIINVSTRQNGTAPWVDRVDNTTNGFLNYILPAEQQYSSTDFNVTLHTDGIQTPFWNNLTWLDQIPTHSVVLTNVSSNYTVIGRNAVYIYAECIELDGNTCLFKTNSTAGSITPGGFFEWLDILTNIGQTIHFYINVTNGYGSVDTKNVNVSIVNAPNNTPLLGRITNINVSGYTFIADTNYPIVGTPVNMTIFPSSDSINVTATKWNTTGDYHKTWIESSINSSVTTQHIIGDFPSNNLIQIKKNGVFFNNSFSNATGYATFNYSGGYSDIQFDADPVAQNTTAISIISNKTLWNSSATPSEPGGNANLNISTGTGSTLVLVTLDSRLNATNANLYAIINEDNSQIFQYNITSNIYEGTDSFIVNNAETTGVHNYQLQLYNTAGKQASIYRWSMSVVYLQTGSFAPNGTVLNPITIPLTPQKGQQFFNTTSNTTNCYDGTAWRYCGNGTLI